MLQIGFFTLHYNLVYSDWNLESTAGVTLIKLFLGVALKFGELWNGGCLEAAFRVIKNLNSLFQMLIMH